MMKEANQVADGLARFGHCQHIGFHVKWLTLPALVEEPVQRDKMCYKWPRLMLKLLVLLLYGATPPLLYLKKTHYPL